MREFKFRAWDIEKKKIIPVLYFDKYECVIASSYEIGDRFRVDSIKHFEIMQFIGHKDKNKKEIFEGDIIKSKHGSIEAIEWDAEIEQSCSEGYGAGFTWECYEIEKSEIIGNIYENPELLKEGK